MLGYLYGAMAPLVAMPWLAAFPAALFAALYIWSRRRIAAGTAVIWGLYGLYEGGMYLGILCSGECNIRVDLLLIYPLLAALSFGALVYSAVRGRKPVATGSPR